MTARGGLPGRRNPGSDTTGNGLPEGKPWHWLDAQDARADRERETGEAVAAVRARAAERRAAERRRLTLIIHGCEYTTAQVRAEAKAAGEMAYALADGTETWHAWNDELCTTDNTAVAIEESAEYARQWREHETAAEMSERGGLAAESHGGK